MSFTDPERVFRGRLCVTVPHMDDCVLACGGTVARLARGSDVHFVYATDGARSPPARFPWTDLPPGLGETRKTETRQALGLLGIPESNLHFLDLPDGRLRRHGGELRGALASRLRDLSPDQVLLPFRYDRHPDHLALHGAVRDSVRLAGLEAELLEYFVYYRWRLLPGRDVRAHLREDAVIRIDIAEERVRKRRALDCFRTQTTCYFPWQDRPILTRGLLDEVCSGPEVFLRLGANRASSEIFARWGPWFRIVHRIEPPLKRLKDVARRAMGRGGSGGGSRGVGEAGGHDGD